MDIKSTSVLIIIFCVSVFSLSAQNNTIDSLRRVLNSQQNDTAKANILNAISAGLWAKNKYDSSLTYANKALALSAKFDKGLAEALNNIGINYFYQGNYPASLNNNLQALNLFEKTGNKKGIASSLIFIGNVYQHEGNYLRAREYRLKALKIYDELGNKLGMAKCLNNIGNAYNSVKDYNKALEYYSKALDICQNINFKFGIAIALANIGNIYYEQHNYPKALQYGSKALAIAEEINDKYDIVNVQIYIGKVYLKQGDYGKAAEYAVKTLNLSRGIGLREYSSALSFTGSVYTGQKKYAVAKMYLDSALLISKKTSENEIVRDVYLGFSELDSAKGDYKNGWNDYKNYIGYRDSLVNQKTIQAEMNYDFDRKSDSAKAVQDKMDAVAAKEGQRQKIIRNSFIGGFSLALFASALFFFQRIRIAKEKARSDESLRHLRQTQEQLVQQEKMATFGQLTVGVAHEIQNPLNFVNNFSEMSEELVDEIREASSPEEKSELLDNLKLCLDKITHHGKRADSIVKSMLAHARSSPGKKEPTDLNKLCNEFLDLSFQGMKANTRDFNCSIEKHFEEKLPNARVIPQDMSRVLINLFNNAFYAVYDKWKTVQDFKPVVSITTRQIEHSFYIIVSDNGKGIAANNQQKIFEPFFTTKPPGEGTGLGLSISYQIVKAHGGEIKVTSDPGNGSTFSVILPM